MTRSLYQQPACVWHFVPICWIWKEICFIALWHTRGRSWCSSRCSKELKIWQFLAEVDERNKRLMEQVLPTLLSSLVQPRAKDAISVCQNIDQHCKTRPYYTYILFVSITIIIILLEAFYPKLLKFYYVLSMHSTCVFTTDTQKIGIKNLNPSTCKWLRL